MLQLYTFNEETIKGEPGKDGVNGADGINGNPGEPGTDAIAGNQYALSYFKDCTATALTFTNNSSFIVLSPDGTYTDGNDSSSEFYTFGSPAYQQKYIGTESGYAMTTATITFYSDNSYQTLEMGLSINGEAAPVAVQKATTGNSGEMVSLTTSWVYPIVTQTAIAIQIRLLTYIQYVNEHLVVHSMTLVTTKI